MSAEQNPQNYPGVTATIVGYASADATNPPYDKDGTRGFKQIRIPINEGYKDKNTGQFVETGTSWYTINAPSDQIGHIRKGDKIRIDDARLETREFTRKDGTTGQAFETRFGNITVLESKTPAPDDDLPF